MVWLDDLRKKKELAGKIPKDLEGKTDEEVIAMISESTTLKAKVAELETKDKEKDAKVQQISTEFEAVKARLAAADAARGAAPPKTEEELADFVNEPDKAFGQRVAPVANLAVSSAKMTARMLAQQDLDNMDMNSPADNKTMDGRLFRAWGADIDAEAAKYNATLLTNPKSWLGIFYYLKGIRSDELNNPEIRKKKYNFLEPAASSVARVDSSTKTPTEQLTDAEKRVADKMGVKHEDYLKRKNAMQFASA